MKQSQKAEVESATVQVPKRVVLDIQKVLHSQLLKKNTLTSRQRPRVVAIVKDLEQACASKSRRSVTMNRAIFESLLKILLWGLKFVPEVWKQIASTTKGGTKG